MCLFFHFALHTAKFCSKSSKNVAQWKNPHWPSGKAVESMNMDLAVPSPKDNRKVYSKNYFFFYFLWEHLE